jgi:hypothetical protein
MTAAVVRSTRPFDATDDGMYGAVTQALSRVDRMGLAQDLIGAPLFELELGPVVIGFERRGSDVTLTFLNASDRCPVSEMSLARLKLVVWLGCELWAALPLSGGEVRFSLYRKDLGLSFLDRSNHPSGADLCLHRS